MDPEENQHLQAWIRKRKGETKEHKDVGDMPKMLG